MDAPKTDPRVLRTRQLIQDAFMSLIERKDIRDITVSDITGKAKVNRATFYAHFADKYELMDIALSNTLRENLKKKLQCHDTFNPGTLVKITVTMCEFHQEFGGHCRRGDQSMASYVETKIKEELQHCIGMLLRHSPDYAHIGDDEQLTRLVSTMLGWSIYGIASDWNRSGGKTAAEETASAALAALARVMSAFAAEEAVAVR